MACDNCNLEQNIPGHHLWRKQDLIFLWCAAPIPKAGLAERLAFGHGHMGTLVSVRTPFRRLGLFEKVIYPSLSSIWHEVQMAFPYWQTYSSACNFFAGEVHSQEVSRRLP
jgi:hypothetical protein